MGDSSAAAVGYSDTEPADRAGRSCRLAPYMAMSACCRSACASSPWVGIQANAHARGDEDRPLLELKRFVKEGPQSLCQGHRGRRIGQVARENREFVAAEAADEARRRRNDLVVCAKALEEANGRLSEDGVAPACPQVSLMALN